MALQISGYVDPGVYIGEVIVPGAVNIATTPAQVAIIGPGSRTRAVSNEAVQRGLVTDEVLTFVNRTGSITSISAPVSGVQTLTDSAGAFALLDVGASISITNASAMNNGTFIIRDRLSATQITFLNASGVSQGASGSYAVVPYAALAERSDRRLQNTTAYRNGVALSDSFLSYRSAFLQGDVTSARDFSTNETMVLALDGNMPLTLRFYAAGGIVSPATGFGASTFTNDGVTTTLTDAGANFPPSIVGQSVTVANATTANNDGTFVITARPSATSIQYADATGTTEAFGGSTTYTIAAYSMARRVGGTMYNIYTSAAGLASVSIAQVAEAINVTLEVADVDGLGYGVSYGAAARSGTDGLRIVSPLSTPASDVQVLAPITGGTAAIGDLNASGASQLFSTYVAADGVLAASYLALSRLAYSASATYTADYVDLDSNEDPLLNTGVSSITRVGSQVGVGNYEDGVDYVLGSDAIDWGGSGLIPDLPPYYPAATTVGPLQTTYPTLSGSNDQLLLSFDGRDSVAVDLAVADPGAASRIAGFTYGLSGSTPTAAQVAANINAVISNSSTYGPRYKAVAAVVNLGSGNFVRLSSPTEGDAGAVRILAPTSNSANTWLFGLAASATVSVTGSGSRPILGAFYFVSYEIDRPAADYNVQKRFFTLDAARADLGATTAENPLMVATEIAFANGAPSVVVVQVDDTSSPGTPTRQEFLNAFAATTRTDVVTDLVPLTTDLAVQTDLKDHVESQSSPTEKHYRRGWFGMARDTDVGDIDTADTYVYRARRTLQVAPDSPARGRLVLVAPPQLSGVSRDITLPDGTVETVELDSSYLAVALAAKKTSFTSPAASLARKSITGFNISDITSPWLGAQRGLLAGQGVMVVTYDAGVFKVLDPVTTEKGGGGLAAFSYESTSSQKDNISRKINQALDASIIGVVPSDLADFIVDIKLIVGGVLAGEIGSGAIGAYVTSDGVARAIDYAKDIEVQQDPNDPTKFFFKYWFMLRYPALRLFGEFSVDNSFFA